MLYYFTFVLSILSVFLHNSYFFSGGIRIYGGLKKIIKNFRGKHPWGLLGLHYQVSEGFSNLRKIIYSFSIELLPVYQDFQLKVSL